MKNGAIVAGAIGAGVPLVSALIQPSWDEIFAAGIGSLMTAGAVILYAQVVEEIDETDAYWWALGAMVGVAGVYFWKGPGAAAKAGASAIAV